METNNYSEYAAIEKHIRDARISRVVVIADNITGFLMDCWNAIKAPPAPAPILIDRRRESRTRAIRNSNRLSHR